MELELPQQAAQDIGAEPEATTQSGHCMSRACLHSPVPLTFYAFAPRSQHEPSEPEDPTQPGRDVFNEKPALEDLMVAEGGWGPAARGLVAGGVLAWRYVGSHEDVRGGARPGS